MGINDGNIFESMRMALPEHRELMEQAKKARTKRKPPQLSEDEISEMQYVLSEAMEAGKQVRITIFEPNHDSSLAGIPMILGGSLRIQTETGIYPVILSKVVRLEIL